MSTDAAQAQAEIEAEAALLSHDDVGDAFSASDPVAAAHEIRVASRSPAADRFHLTVLGNDPLSAQEEIAAALAEDDVEDVGRAEEAVASVAILGDDPASAQRDIEAAVLGDDELPLLPLVSRALPPKTVKRFPSIAVDPEGAEHEIAAEAVGSDDYEEIELSLPPPPPPLPPPPVQPPFVLGSDPHGADADIAAESVSHDSETRHVPFINDPVSAEEEVALEGVVEENEAPPSAYTIGSDVIGAPVARRATPRQVAERAIETKEPVLAAREITYAQPKWRDWTIDFGPVFGPAGAIVTVTVNPQVIFRGEKVMATDSHSQPGRGSRVVDVFVGQKSQRPAAAKSTLTAFFSNNALGNGITWDTCPGKGIQLQVVVEFIQDCTFSMTVFGKAVEET